MVAKGLMGLAAVTVVAAAPATFFIVNSKNSPPVTATLTNYREGSYTGKYANYFGKHFVTATEDNKAWWDKSFNRLTEQKNKADGNTSSAFQAVTEAFGENAASSLNKLCESYHSKTYTEINTGSQSGKPSTIQDFWKFCTTVEAELELISSSSSGTIGNKHKNILIAAGQDKNKMFWNIQEEIFFENPSSDFSNLTNSNFLALYSLKSSGSRRSLREMCEEAYKLPENEQQKSNGVDKYCSISAQSAT